MIRKLTLTALIIGLLLIALTIYVGATISDELKAVQSLLSGPLADLDEGSLQHAEAGLRSAKQRLDDLPVKVLGLLPVAHQNLEAIDAAIDAALPVLESAQELRSTTDRIMTSELVDDGNLDLTLLGGLVGPLDAQTEELAHLEDSLAAGRSGWLLPPVWDAIDQLHRKVSRLLRSAANAADAVRIAESMLGGDEPRTYLVLLMNNAELRGAGGILSSIGTLDIDDGEIRLGRFRHYRELQDEKPYREVEAPPDLERRFGRYRADKTVWVNTTASPDVPEVGLVATRLYELKTGVRVDGAILVDPRGISAMMPKGAVIRIPGGEISSEELPRFVYSDVYERYETGHPGRRRSAVLDVGRRAFQSVVQEGFKNRQSFLSTASAIRAGHIAFFSVESSEQRVLERIGAAGDLEPTATDNLLVTVQNYAADKLDFWMDRSIRHRCAITDGAVMYHRSHP